MKLYNKIFLSLISSIVMLTSCDYEDKFDVIKPDDSKLEESSEWYATTTLSKLKEKYLNNNEFLISKNAHSSKYANMFSVFQIPTDSVEIINAVVVSTDIEGATYKKLVLRDLTDNSGLDISVEVSGASTDWPVGQVVAINCAGLHIGDYANFPCLGLLTHNTTRDRYEPGRIPYPILKDQIKSFGMPDITLAEPVEVTINDILTQKEAFYSQRVTIKGVRFGYYKTSATNSTPSNFLTNYINMIDDTKEQIVFSEENDLNVPVSRVIKDNAGNTISVTTSFYAKFAGEYLPQGEYDIIAVIAWYRDQERNTGNFQLAIQQIGDIIKVEN